jgi:protein farnesyltransferase subunit beta
MPLPVDNVPHVDCLFETETTEDQEDTLRECKPFFVNLAELGDTEVAHLRRVGLVHPESMNVCLLHEKHAQYMSRAFGTLSSSFVSLDASRPWMLYWTLHGCDLLGDLPSRDVLNGIVSTLQACWQQVSRDSGGFGGGPGQMAHCAPTYAAVLCLCIIATSEDLSNEIADRARKFLETIRKPLLKWYLTLQEPNGAYRMHLDGEIDVRATYTIVCCAKLLNIMTDELASDAVVDFVGTCQTFEGGFGGEPGSEAHGGYTFCAVAALQIMERLQDADVPALRGWLVRRQMSYEGGFQGRCNKLVDGCYSFWQGGALAIVSAIGLEGDPWLDSSDELPPLLCVERLLQRYILLCAQDVNGGLRDKPSKPRDFYHSCYNLSGLSVSQHCGELAYGHPASSLVAKTHPCFNVRIDRAEKMLLHFASSN